MIVSWVIPTVDGREEGLLRATEYPMQWGCQTIVLQNKPTCGAAWVEGAREADGEFIYFAADDIVAHAGFIEAMVSAVNDGEHPAALVLEPSGEKQSCGGSGSGVCVGSCRDGQFVEWSPTPFVSRAQWDLIEPHADMLAGLHYSSDRLVSAILAKHGIPSVFRPAAKITHFNDPVGRLWTAGGDSEAFEQYRRTL